MSSINSAEQLESLEQMRQNFQRVEASTQVRKSSTSRNGGKTLAAKDKLAARLAVCEVYAKQTTELLENVRTGTLTQLLYETIQNHLRDGPLVEFPERTLLKQVLELPTCLQALLTEAGIKSTGDFYEDIVASAGSNKKGVKSFTAKQKQRAQTFVAQNGLPPVLDKAFTELLERLEVTQRKESTAMEIEQEQHEEEEKIGNEQKIQVEEEKNRKKTENAQVADQDSDKSAQQQAWMKSADELVRSRNRLSLAEVERLYEESQRHGDAWAEVLSSDLFMVVSDLQGEVQEIRQAVDKLLRLRVQLTVDPSETINVSLAHNAEKLPLSEAEQALEELRRAASKFEVQSELARADENVQLCHALRAGIYSWIQDARSNSSSSSQRGAEEALQQRLADLSEALVERAAYYLCEEQEALLYPIWRFFTRRHLSGACRGCIDDWHELLACGQSFVGLQREDNDERTQLIQKIEEQLNFATEVKVFCAKLAEADQFEVEALVRRGLRFNRLIILPQYDQLSALHAAGQALAGQEAGNASLSRMELTQCRERLEAYRSLGIAHTRIAVLEALVAEAESLLQEWSELEQSDEQPQSKKRETRVSRQRTRLVALPGGEGGNVEQEKSLRRGELRRDFLQNKYLLSSSNLIIEKLEKELPQYALARPKQDSLVDSVRRALRYGPRVCEHYDIIETLILRNVDTLKKASASEEVTQNSLKEEEANILMHESFECRVRVLRHVARTRCTSLVPEEYVRQLHTRACEKIGSREEDEYRESLRFLDETLRVTRARIAQQVARESAVIAQGQQQFNNCSDEDGDSAAWVDVTAEIAKALGGGHQHQNTQQQLQEQKQQQFAHNTITTTSTRTQNSEMLQSTTTNATTTTVTENAPKLSLSNRKVPQQRLREEDSRKEKASSQSTAHPSSLLQKENLKPAQLMKALEEGDVLSHEDVTLRDSIKSITQIQQSPEQEEDRTHPITLEERYQKYKAVFTIRLARQIEDNVHMELGVQSAIDAARRIADKLYEHLASEKQRIFAFGDRLLDLFVRLKAYKKLSKRVADEELNFQLLIGLKDKNEKSLSIMNECGELQRKSVSPDIAKQAPLPLPVARKQPKQLRIEEATPAFKAGDRSQTNNNDGFDDDDDNEIAVGEHCLREVRKAEKQRLSKVAAASVAKGSTQMMPTKHYQPAAYADYDDHDDDEEPPIYDSEQRCLRVFQGTLQEGETVMEKISLLSAMKFEQLQYLPQAACNLTFSGEGSLKVARVYSQKNFEDYFDLILRTTSGVVANTNIKRNIIAHGWIESELFHHNEAMRRFALRLRDTRHVALISWSEQCKFYLMHRDSLATRWKSKLYTKAPPARLHYFNDSNLLWICVFKRYKVDAIRRLIPEILPERSENFISKRSVVAKSQNTPGTPYTHPLSTLQATPKATASVGAGSASSLAALVQQPPPSFSKQDSFIPHNQDFSNENYTTNRSFQQASVPVNVQQDLTFLQNRGYIPNYSTNKFSENKGHQSTIQGTRTQEPLLAQNSNINNSINQSQAHFSNFRPRYENNSYNGFNQNRHPATTTTTTTATAAPAPANRTPSPTLSYHNQHSAAILAQIQNEQANNYRTKKFSSVKSVGKSQAVPEDRLINQLQQINYKLQQIVKETAQRLPDENTQGVVKNNFTPTNSIQSLASQMSYLAPLASSIAPLIETIQQQQQQINNLQQNSQQYANRGYRVRQQYPNNQSFKRRNPYAAIGQQQPQQQQQIEGFAQPPQFKFTPRQEHQRQIIRQPQFDLRYQEDSEDDVPAYPQTKIMRVDAQRGAATTNRSGAETRQAFADATNRSIYQNPDFKIFEQNYYKN